MTTERRYSKERSKEIASTILKQLGGNKFIAMTGAKNLGFGDGSLSFNIGRNAKKVNQVEIILGKWDLYKVIFRNINMRRNDPVEIIKEVDGVYDNMLQEIFEENTGMYTKLF